MSKQSCFRRCFDKHHGKRAQVLLKSALQHLYHIHLSLPKKVSAKTSLLLPSKILGLLVNTLITDEKYLVLHRDNSRIPIQMQLYQKQKRFSQFFAEFLKSRLNFGHFDRKGNPHIFCICKITNSENMVRKMSKKSCLRGPFAKQHGKCDQALLKTASQYFYHIHRSLPRKLSSKTSLLLTWQILGLLVNTLATDEKDPVLNRENLTMSIQMQLPQKQKSFSQFFRAFLKYLRNYQIFG